MELTNLGWNIFTISFFGAILVVIVGSWGQYHQNKKIWANESGKVIAIKWFMVLTFMYAAFFIRGLGKCNNMLIFQGSIRTILSIPIILGLYRFKGFTKVDWCLLSTLIPFIVLMTMFPESDILIYLISCIAIISACTQPWEIWKEKEVGELSIKLLIIYTVGSMVWSIYWLYSDDLSMKIISISFFVVNTITFFTWIWFKYFHKTDYRHYNIESK